MEYLQHRSNEYKQTWKQQEYKNKMINGIWTYVQMGDELGLRDPGKGLQEKGKWRRDIFQQL